VSRTDARDGAETDRVEMVGALASVSRVLMALTARTLGAMDVDVTLSQYRALVVLASRGPQRTVDLAVELGVQPSTVTRSCDRLIRRGLVRRCRRPDDRRVAWLGLTEQGKEFVGTAMRQRQAAIARLAGAIDIPDPRPVTAALTALVEAAGETPDPQWWDRWALSALDGDGE
jgi:DNA-binding MarR family transcriptional regulator